MIKASFPRTLRPIVAVAVLVALTVAIGADDAAGPAADAAGPAADAAGPVADATAGNPFARERVEWSMVPSAVELAATLETLATVPLAEWHGADQIAIWKLQAAADAEYDRIRRAGRLSLIVPGLGHYASGAFGEAVAFAATDALIAATGIVLVGLALPPAVQPRNVDYLQRSFLEIEAIWYDVTPIELLPAAVVAVSFAALQFTVRALASRHAEWFTMDALQAGLIRARTSPSSARLRSCSSRGE